MSSSAEESPAQQAARLRRERREAKIKSGGSARLDKITSLSGRTTSSAREDAPSPPPQPRSPSAPAAGHPDPPEQVPQASPSPFPPTPRVHDDSPESIRAQQEYLRALLRSNPPEQQAQQKLDQDPTMKLLSAMLGGVPGAENTAPGSGMAPPSAGDLQPGDLTSALGLPSLLSKMFLGGAGAPPPTPAEKQREAMWKLLHVVFALATGFYLLMLIGSSVATYGRHPPPPATAQNPFVIFMTGELLLSGARVLQGSGPGGTLNTVMQLVRSFIKDGSLAVFVLGVGAWWTRGWQAAVGSS